MTHRMLIALAVSFGLLLGAGCANPRSVVPEAIQNPTGPRDAAIVAACKANLRAIYSSVQAFEASNGRMPTVSDLAAQPGGIPKEPAGGYYTIDPSNGTVICSVPGHGQFPE